MAIQLHNVERALRDEVRPVPGTGDNMRSRLGTAMRIDVRARNMVAQSENITAYAHASLTLSRIRPTTMIGGYGVLWRAKPA